jgi:hypothetical protein
LALELGKKATRTDNDRWEGYALSGGALMNLKRYNECAEELQKAIKRAPETKQPGLVGLRQQCLSARPKAESGNKHNSGAVTQAEIVLWKTIENSTNKDDFLSYLNEYPNGAFAALARRHVEEAKAQLAAESELQNRQHENLNRYVGRYTSQSSSLDTGDECTYYFHQELILQPDLYNEGALHGKLENTSTFRGTGCANGGDESSFDYDAALTCEKLTPGQISSACAVGLKLTGCRGSASQYCPAETARCSNLIMNADGFSGVYVSSLTERRSVCKYDRAT